jgi:Meiotically Up-regulated Gene 113 (MUG113) protein
VADAEAKLEEIRAAVDGVDDRAANVRAGYVYVISNVGAFGERMVKIGMTRRLDPLDRVRELGDASVPFRYDVHAVIFSRDAVELETRLHHELAEHRVNLVNTRREFFYATPTEVRDVLSRLDGNSVLTFTEEPEALEWRQSENLRPAP